MTPEQRAYIRAIRSESKKDYAFAWAMWVDGKGDRPANPSGLSYMAAQAVRMNLGEPIEKKETN